MRHQGVISVCFMLLHVVHVKSLKTFDCSNTTKISHIDARSVADCKPFTEDEIYVTNFTAQIFQRKKIVHLDTYSCYVREHILIHNCGAFSHLSMVDHGFIKQTLTLTKQECANMHEDRSFTLYGVKVSDLALNTKIERHIRPYGTLTEQGDCLGTAFSTKYGSYTKAVMQVNVEIKLTASTAKLDIEQEQILFNGGTVCKEQDNGCFLEDKGHTFWEQHREGDCDRTRQDIIYQGPIELARIRNDSQDLGIITVNNDHGIFAYKLSKRSSICYQDSFLTDHKRISVILREKNDFFFKSKNTQIDPSNVDMTLYTNSKINYITHSLSKTIKSVFLDSKTADCLLHKKILENRLAHARTQKTTHTHLITGERGYLNILSGEIFYILQCTEVEVQLRRTLDCYTNIPVFHNKRAMFVEPITNTLSHTGHQIPCSFLTPPMYSIQGEWFKITPRPVPTKEPKKLQPDYIETGIPIVFEDFSRLLNLGIYSDETMTDFASFITYPFQREYAITHITDAVVHSNTGINSFHLENLFSSDQLKNLSTSLLEYVKPGLQTIGTVGGTLFMVMLICQVFSYGVSIVLNFKILHKTFGWTFALGASVFTALTTYLINNKYESVSSPGETENAEELKEIQVDNKLYPEVDNNTSPGSKNME